MEKRLEKTQEEMQTLSEGFRKLNLEATKQFQQATSEATGRITEVEDRVRKLFERYDWLNSPEIRGAADEVSSLVSVKQAHDAAVKFRFARDYKLARLALRQITERQLLGDADDFHNAHAEAMKIDDSVLGLAIIEEGLGHFPDQYDLMADKALMLISAGKVQEATRILEDWRSRKPIEFARGWRPVVFYANSVQAGDLTNEAVEKLEQAFADVTQRLPFETKPWSSYARFEKKLGASDKAETILLEGLKHNPYSQELNYILGELLLQQGRAQDSIQYLEMALKVDYQEQFQHDVNQDAVKTTLAQAYEAIGDTGKAELIYRAVLKYSDLDLRPHIYEYAKNRLYAIATLRGEIIETEGGDEQQSLKLLQTLASSMKSASNNTEAG